MSEPENKSINDSADTQDVETLIQQVLRESYQQATEDLRSYADKVKYYNRQKKAIRDYLNSLRDFKSRVISAAHKQGTSLCSVDKKDVEALKEIIAKAAQPYEVGLVEHELCIPNRVPNEDLHSLNQFDNEISRWESQLNSIGDDAQLANVDLQNMLQKQQQILQMMSNVSKMTHDTLMSIIRKIGG